MLQRGTAQDSVNYFLDVPWTLLIKHIPRKVVRNKRSSHPWLNTRCREAIIQKNRAEGTDTFATAQSACDDVLREERSKYVETLKAKMAALPRCSKQWWRINRELLRRKANVATIPPLRDGPEWLLDAKAKADAFANTFVSKSELAPEVVDTPFFGIPELELDEFVAFRTRYTKQLFRALDPSKATGSDKISAVILKRLSDSLAMPFTRVCRRLYYEGCWPDVWKMHLLVPIYKRGSAFNPSNYRGVHLTSILSKLAEKVIGARLILSLKLNAGC